VIEGFGLIGFIVVLIIGKKGAKKLEQFLNDVKE